MLKNIVRLLIYILITIIIICVFILSRRIWFMEKYKQKMEEHQNSLTSFYNKRTYYSKDENLEAECFYKDNIIKTISIGPNMAIGNTFYMNLDTNEDTIIYEEEKKYQTININHSITPMSLLDSLGYTYCETIKEKLDFMSEIGFIRLDKCNGKQCYLIEIRSGMKVWLDIETFLPIRTLGELSISTLEKGTVDEIVEYDFKLNQVTDEDIAIPDLSEYTVIENE